METAGRGQRKAATVRGKGEAAKAKQRILVHFIPPESGTAESTSTEEFKSNVSRAFLSECNPHR